MQTEAYESRNGNLLRVRIDRLIANAKNEVFADGMDSNFSRQLHRIIETFGHRAIKALEMAMERRLNAEVAEELLRQLGYMEDSGTHDGRLNILLQSLKSPDRAFGMPPPLAWPPWTIEGRFPQSARPIGMSVARWSKTALRWW